MLLKQFLIFIVIVCIAPTKMFYSLMHDTVYIDKIDINIEKELEEDKENKKKEKEEHKYISRTSMNLDITEKLVKVCIYSHSYYSSPLLSTNTPPPDFI